MSMILKIRHQLKELGFRPHMRDEIEALGVQLTVCQLIVVVLSIISVVFLFVPLFYLQDVKFMLVFFSLSLICLGCGIWFWVHRAEICEHPEEVEG